MTVPEQKEAYFTFYRTVPSKIETQSQETRAVGMRITMPESLCFGDTVRPVLV